MEISGPKSASKCSGLVATGVMTQRINWFCGLRGGGGGLAGFEGENTEARFYHADTDQMRARIQIALPLSLTVWPATVNHHRSWKWRFSWRGRLRSNTYRASISARHRGRVFWISWSVAARLLEVLNSERIQTYIERYGDRTLRRARADFPEQRRFADGVVFLLWVLHVDSTMLHRAMVLCISAPFLKTEGKVIDIVTLCVRCGKREVRLHLKQYQSAWTHRTGINRRCVHSENESFH